MIEEPRTVAEIEADMEAQVAREMTAFSPEVMRSTALRKQLLEKSKSSPENVAMVVRGWLQDGKENKKRR
jgi:flagellar biosynthesis/type III secretory pathway M-ring protein FliF/YscJ